MDNKLDRLQTILTYAVIVFAIFAVIVGATERREFAETLELNNHVLQIALWDKEHYENLAEQYKLQYNEAVLEIAELKQQNEELIQQIDTLREPTTNAYKDIGWDFDYVVRVVGAESRGEPIEGILAVCQCIQDTAERTGHTPEWVVKHGGYTTPLSRAVTDNMDTVNECCLLVFLNRYKPFSEPIEYFYAPQRVASAWHESQVFCYEIGGHRFFKGAV